MSSFKVGDTIVNVDPVACKPLGPVVEIEEDDLLGLSLRFVCQQDSEMTWPHRAEYYKVLESTEETITFRRTRKESGWSMSWFEDSNDYFLSNFDRNGVLEYWEVKVPVSMVRKFRQAEGFVEVTE